MTGSPLQNSQGLPGAGFQISPGVFAPAMVAVDSSGAEVSGDTTGTGQPAGSSGVSVGTVVDLGKVSAAPAMQLTASAALTAGTLLFQGSIDNVSWYTMATVTAATAFSGAGGTILVAPGETAPTGVTGPAVGQVVPARYLRANITVAITGGTIAALLGGV